MDEIYPCPDAAERATIIERTRLWLERAVIGLNLCPFAKSVFVKKQIRYALTAAATADELLAELEQERVSAWIALYRAAGGSWPEPAGAPDASALRTQSPAVAAAPSRISNSEASHD